MENKYNKFYYVSFLTAKGYGATTFQCVNFLNLKKAKEWIIEQNNDSTITIMNVVEISQEQFDAGI